MNIQPGNGFVSLSDLSPEELRLIQERVAQYNDDTVNREAVVYTGFSCDTDGKKFNLVSRSSDGIEKALEGLKP